MNLAAPLAGAAILLMSTLASEAQPAPEPPRNVCLNVNNIQRTETPDDQTIVFHMRDGKVWSNTLKRRCPMLRTSPYAQVLRSGGLVCSNQQFIHVLQTGDTCMLGDFTPVPADKEP